MKTLAFIAALIAGLISAQAPAAPITYQGQLQQSGGPHTGTLEMTFSLWNAETAGTQMGPILVQDVTVTDGLFQAELDFGAVFDAGTLWLEIAVAGELLTPRQQVTAAPVAIHALSGGDGSPWSVLGNNDIIYQSGRVGIGTNDPVSPLNVVGRITLGSAFNLASGLNSFVSGGDGTDVNFASGDMSFIGGGYGNQTVGIESFVGGGDNNHAAGQASFIGGGNNNDASGNNGFVGGGFGNVANGTSGFVGGGRSNDALGDFSFAAGSRAKAHHPGTFVWSDNATVSDFVSTADYQFLIRAGGGAGINTNDPGNFALRVDGGSVGRGGIRVDTAADGSIVPFSVVVNTVTRLRLLSDGGLSVGSGTAAPENGLRVQGEVHLTTLATAGSTDLCRNTLNRIATCSSSRRYKQDIADLGSAADLIGRLRPVSFRWIQGGHEGLGLVAEEVAKVEPSLVTSNSEGEIEGVRYRELTAVLVKALQEQQAENAELRAELARVREDTEARLAALEELSTGEVAVSGQ